jgi:SRSO17 transposase
MELSIMLNGIPVNGPNILPESGIEQMNRENANEVVVEHLKRYIPYLWRKEQYAHFMSIIIGLLSDIKRKCLQHICLALLLPAALRNYYHFMRSAKWDEEGMLREHIQEVAEVLSCRGGMFVIDSTDCPKKGSKSVGVASQYAGSLGHTANCQVSVFIGYCAEDGGHCNLVGELFMPEKWFDDDHADLRRSCLVPEGLEFETKNSIASRLLNNIWDMGLFEGKYVGIDSAFGRDSAFLASIPKELIYFADIPCDQHVFLGHPTMEIPEYSGKGRRPTIPIPSFPAVTVDSIAKNDDIPWHDVVLGTGSKGPIFAKDKCVRVVESHNNTPGAEVWLYIRELEDGSLKYALCNDSADASPMDIRKPALMRWSIEQSFKECKTNLGMNHYQTRSWIGWRRHILLTLICQLLVLKLIRKFSTKTDIPLEIPAAIEPVETKEFLDAVVAHLENRTIESNSVQTVAKAPVSFMTIGVVLKWLNMYLIKNLSVLQSIAFDIKNYAKSFCSHSRRRVKQKLSEFGIPLPKNWVKA